MEALRPAGAHVLPDQSNRPTHRNDQWTSVYCDQHLSDLLSHLLGNNGNRTLQWSNLDDLNHGIFLCLLSSAGGSIAEPSHCLGVQSFSVEDVRVTSSSVCCDVSYSWV